MYKTDKRNNNVKLKWKVEQEIEKLEKGVGGYNDSHPLLLLLLAHKFRYHTINRIKRKKCLKNNRYYRSQYPADLFLLIWRNEFFLRIINTWF